MDAALAIDIGGTKLAAAVVDRCGTFLSRSTRPTLHDDPAGLWSTLVALCDEVMGATLPTRPTVCGVGCGGPMSPGGSEVSPLNIPAWRSFPLRERLAAHTGLPTWVDNDAKALALAEGWRGAAVGRRDYLAMVVSTGVGGGLVLDGRLVDGASGNAGHIGHVLVAPGGRRCACGARGCLEAEASGTALRSLTGREPARASAQLRARTGMFVGRAVASVANLCDLPLAVVAGSVALGFGTTFFDAAQAELDRSCRLAFSRGTVIRPAQLGADGPLLGAAAVAWRGSRGAP